MAENVKCILITKDYFKRSPDNFALVIPHNILTKQNKSHKNITNVGNKKKNRHTVK